MGANQIYTRSRTCFRVKTSGKSSNVKVEILSTGKLMYKVFVDGGTEVVINYVKVHKIILADCKVKEEAVASRSLLLANRHTLWP